MHAGVIPSSPGAFGHAISGPVRVTLVASPPRRRLQALPTTAPHCSVWLAKKSLRRTPAVVSAQNVLLKKIGFLENQKIMTDNIDNYILRRQQLPYQRTILKVAS
jgi:hypothetical protein